MLSQVRLCQRAADPGSSAGDQADVGGLDVSHPHSSSLGVCPPLHPLQLRHHRWSDRTRKIFQLLKYFLGFVVGLAVMQLLGFSVFCFFLIIVFSFYQVFFYEVERWSRNVCQTLLIGIDCPNHQRYHHWEAVRVDLYVVFVVCFLSNIISSIHVKGHSMT